MSTYDDYRTIDIAIDGANDYPAQIIVSTGDTDGRRIRAKFLVDGTPVTDATGAAIYYGNDNVPADSVPMTEESDGIYTGVIPTAAYAGKACATVTVGLKKGDSIVMSRSIRLIIDHAFGDDAPDNIDAGQLEDAISRAETAADNAADSATAAREAVDGFGLTVGSVTTAEPGTDAAVDITKDGTQYTADFTIPRGDKGESAVIEHNKTLVGDGTPGSPLSIADGTLLSVIDVLGSFDFNDKKASGAYTVNSADATNSPRQDRAAYGTLFVAPTSVDGGVIQLFFSVESTEIKAYLRLLRNEWRPWKSIPMSTNVSTLESRIAALNAKSNELADVETRVQALEARIKSLETN